MGGRAFGDAVLRAAWSLAPSGLAVFVLGFALLGGLIAAPSAAQAQTCAAGSVTFTAVSTSQTLNAQSCDVQIPPENTWGGLFETSTGDAYSYYGLGVDDFGAASAETFETTQAVYSFSGNLSTDVFTITLVSLKAGATVSDTISLFTCPLVDSVNLTCLTTRTTTIAVTLPVPPEITTTTLPGGAVAAAYSQTIATTGGSAPLTFTVHLGDLPAGLSLSTAGVLSGTPTAGGDFPVTIRVSDANSRTDDQAYTLSIAPPTVAIQTTTLPTPAIGAAYSQTLTASGGTAPYAFTTSDPLPTGLTLSSAGVLSGTPTASGTFAFTVTAADASTGTGPYTATQAYSLTVALPTLSLSPGSLPGATVAAPYSQTLTANGGTPGYIFATSDPLPAGVTLSSGGVLSGTPTAGGSFTFSVTATDSTTGTGPATGSQVYTLNVAAPTLSLSPGSLPGATVGAAYSQSVTANGGTSPYAYSTTPGDLPAGVTLSPTGVLSGTPTAGGSFAFTVTVQDSSTGTGPYSTSTAYTLSVAAPTITINPTTLAPMQVGAPYSATVAASGGTSGYRYSVTGGALPTGLELFETGEISGAPTSGGSYNVTITATDSSTGQGAPYAGSRAYSGSVAAPTITLTASLPNGTAYVSYSTMVAASGGVGPYTYGATGTLPPGLTLATNGTLSGTPTTPGSYSFTVTATDPAVGGPYFGSQAYTVSIAAPTIVLPPTTLAGGSVNAVYSQLIVPASGGLAPYTYALANGSVLPPGLTLSPSGVISGTPTQIGTYNFTVMATDSSPSGPYSATQTYSITVAEQIVIVPTLTEWAMMMLAALLAGAGALVLNRRRVAQ
ncbi:MAG: beta strand repeat-containing protein [Brevundimonas sp.]|uniref:beta strand repeat-containing protein n=1 Tax=Brevundimonas sp. TaxID=1871086 RepID=UPI00403335B7